MTIRDYRIHAQQTHLEDVTHDEDLISLECPQPECLSIFARPRDWVAGNARSVHPCPGCGVGARLPSAQDASLSTPVDTPTGAPR